MKRENYSLTRSYSQSTHGIAYVRVTWTFLSEFCLFDTKVVNNIKVSEN